MPGSKKAGWKRGLLEARLFVPPPFAAFMDRRPAAGGWIRRLDPRAKLVGVLLYALAVMAADRPFALLVLLAVGAVALLRARPSADALRLGLRPVLWLGLAVFLLHLLWGPGMPFARAGSWPPFGAGAWAGFTVLARLAAVGLAAAFLFASTAVPELMEAATCLLRPLRRVGVPAEDVSLVLSLSLRFIPLLAEEAERVGRAQRARALEWDEGLPWQRLARRGTVALPLLVGLFRRADAVAAAMEARAYCRGAARTRLYTRNWRRSDTAFVLLAGCVLAFGLTGHWWPGSAFF